MKKQSWYSIKNLADKDVAEIYLYDEIGMFGITAKDFAADLKAVTQSRIDLHVNSPGGSVVDGQAIYALLCQHPANITAYIDGYAASIATVICCGADKVIMADGALYCIHAAMGPVYGNAEEMRESAEFLDKISATIAAVYAKKTGLSLDKIDKMMKDETFMLAPEAKELGFVDEIGEGLAAAAKFSPQHLDKVPARLRAAAGAILAAVDKPALATPSQNSMSLFNKEAVASLAAITATLVALGLDAKKFETLDGAKEDLEKLFTESKGIEAKNAVGAFRLTPEFTDLAKRAETGAAQLARANMFHAALTNAGVKIPEFGADEKPESKVEAVQKAITDRASILASDTLAKQGHGTPLDALPGGAAKDPAADLARKIQEENNPAARAKLAKEFFALTAPKA